MQLTKSQKEAITYSGRNLQLIACAGSGKTEVVAQRVAHLLTKKGKGRLEPRNIVAFTFTEKAAAELKDRIVKRSQEAAGGDVTGMAEMYVGTIHGFCRELLQTEIPDYQKYEALNAVRQTLYMDKNASRTGVSSTHLRALAVLREDHIRMDKLNGNYLLKNLEKYRDKLKVDAYFDFTSMLENAVHELKHNYSLRQNIAKRVKYLVVDEYQDVNPIQEDLIRLLHDLGASLCVVGDDDQTIYQWRGSSVSNILKFEENYPNVKQIRLEDNFRSSQGVVETAHQSISAVEPRLSKEMKFAKAQTYQVGDIVTQQFQSADEEAEYIAETIRSLHGVAFNDGERERGLTWSDMAVLIRLRKIGGPIIKALQAVGVPFDVKGLTNLFDSHEAQAARAIFHYIAGESISTGAQNSMRFTWGSSVMQVPPNMTQLKMWWDGLGITRRNLNNALKYVREVREVLNSKSSKGPTIQYVYLQFLNLAKIREELIPNGQGETVLYNLGKFSQVISDWESINFGTRRIQSFRGFVNFLYHQAPRAYGEGEEDTTFGKRDAVEITTVHQAKGREWPVVFLPSLVKDLFPPRHRRRDELWNHIDPDGIEDSGRYDGSIEDERRLFYVGMTRSKKYLHMTCWTRSAWSWYRRPAIFWQEILDSKWVSRRKFNYAKRRRLPAEAKVSESSLEFSFSNLKYLLDCGYQFKLRALYGFNGPIAEALGYGKLLHNALGEIHMSVMRGELADVANLDVPGLVERHLRLPYATLRLRKRLEELAIRDIANYIHDKAGDFHHIEFFEQPVEIHLDDAITIKGRMDLVRRTDTGVTTIVDMKSSEHSQDEDVTEAQLHTYALCYKSLTGQDADFVEIYMLRERESHSMPVSDHLIGNIRSKTQEAAVALRSKKLYPEPSQEKCKRCDFSMLCSASMA